MNRYRNYFSIILLLIVVSLVVTFRSFLFAYIILPVAVLFWVAWRFILAVDQNTYWLILMFLCSALMMRFFPFSKKRISRPAYDYRISPANRVEYWQEVFEKSLSNDIENTTLRESIQGLVVSAIATSQKSRSSDVAQMIASGQLCLPPEARRYLFSTKKEDPSSPGIKWVGSWRATWQKMWNKNTSSSNQDSVHEVLRWTEDFLEIEHER